MVSESVRQLIVEIVREHYPEVQGIYLFGSHGTDDEWPGSDVDIALLLPPEAARREKFLISSPCRDALEKALGKEVDLINARFVSTVFQKEIIGGGHLLFQADAYAVDEFEMLVMSYYQKLNDERREILEAFEKSGRAYPV